VFGDLPDADLDKLQQTTSRYPDDPLLKAGALSLTLEEEGLREEPAAGREVPASLRFDPDTLNRLVRRLDARGWQIVTVAPSDATVRMSLNAYEHAVRSNPGRTAERRHRIHNVEAVADEDLPRFAPLGILTSLRPLDDESQGSGGLPALARRMASGRGRVALGSGWPAASLNPLLGLSAVLTPLAETDGDENTRLTLKAAIDAYTFGAAWGSFDEQRKGTIAPGMLADIVMLSDDIFKAPISDLPGVRVDMTIFDGKIVYRRVQNATN
jgi:predicted amidohydrolase YtcJ